MKKINIISIHYGHNATVALSVNGIVKYCVSEERFNRIKNSTGWPKRALEYIQKKCHDNPDYYVLTQESPAGYLFLKKHNHQNFAYGNKKSTYPVNTPWKFRLFPNFIYQRIARNIEIEIKKNNNVNLKKEAADFFSNLLQTAPEKIILLDHHQAHALSTLYFEKEKNIPKLIFTLDGEGDGLSATVSKKQDDEVVRLSCSSKTASLGYLYRGVTALLGMKPDEHEFKVMGLSPYAKEKYVDALLPIFENVLFLNDKGDFESNIPMSFTEHYLRENLSYERFDNIAGAIQKFTEKIVINWIDFWIKKTDIHDINLAGGVFMNVKMNQRISEKDAVRSISITPSAGDESTVFGGLYWGNKIFHSQNNTKFDINTVDDVYLGTEYSDAEIEEYLTKNHLTEKFQITKIAEIEKELARLLTQNEIIARFAGKMEFGARALGNRSILANPTCFENIQTINEMVKNRDFWMPFATSIIEEDADIYINNPKNIDASFMTITFNTSASAQKELTAAIHPYDKTSRPQIVKESTNSSYHKIISEFKNITGIGGLLNTSFNLHGEPNVESLKDAIHTFENSGLNYLAIGSYLLKK